MASFPLTLIPLEVSSPGAVLSMIALEAEKGGW